MNNRNTKQRKLIYDVVVSNKDHPTAYTIYEEVKKIDPKISMATVYRNLNILSELGEINHIKIPDRDRFDFNVSKHYHILCTVCGEVIDSPIPYNEQEDEKLSLDTGFRIIGHRTVFEGICPKCQKKLENKSKKEK